jgi:hypothetical protein
MDTENKTAQPKKEVKLERPSINPKFEDLNLEKVAGFTEEDRVELFKFQAKIGDLFADQVTNLANKWGLSAYEMAFAVHGLLCDQMEQNNRAFGHVATACGGELRVRKQPTAEVKNGPATETH